MRCLRPDERRVEASAALRSSGDDQGEGDGFAVEWRDCIRIEHRQLYSKQEGWRESVLAYSLRVTDIVFHCSL